MTAGKLGADARLCIHLPQVANVCAQMKRFCWMGITLCSVFYASLGNACQYYKWVDENGVTHFSEKPVLGADAKKMTNTSKNSEIKEDAPADPQSGEGTAAPAAVATDPAAQTQIDEKNCKTAQDRLKALQSGQRIRLMGADGQFSYLDQNQITEETRKTQEVLRAQCTKAAP